LIFAQESASVRICNSSVEDLIKAKELKYNEQRKFYYYDNGKEITDVLTVKDGKPEFYQKLYYYVTEDKKRKALNIFLDTSFTQDKRHQNEDNLDEEYWFSRKYKYAVLYEPKGNFHLKITLYCILPE
jgi:hypothetical protein